MNCTKMCAGAIVALAGVSFGAGAQETGPSTGWSPNLLPIDAGVRTISVLSVGDSVPALSGSGVYRMVGIPDGMGALDNNDGTCTLLLNHELNSAAGVERAHGSIGAFVSKWILSLDTFEVLGGGDLIQSVGLWNAGTESFDMGTTVFSRFCSGDLAEPGAFYNDATGLGTMQRIYLTGEETGAEGRAFATFVDGPEAGTAYEFAAMGKTSFENVVANPATGDTTVIAGLDDSTGGQVYFYYGTKRDAGTEMEKAGLIGGRVYGLRIPGVADEDATGLGGMQSASFELADLGDVSTMTGADLQSASDLAGVTCFARPEDGAWVPGNANEFYWLTTGTSAAPTRAWKMTFADVTDPSAGGIIEIVVTGDSSSNESLPAAMDNMGIDEDAQVLIQEDPGSAARLAKIWNYNPFNGGLTVMAEYDADYFVNNGQPAFITTNEESSGIIPMTDILGDGWFVLSSQVHAGVGDAELVEDGQIVLMYSALHNGCAADLVAPFGELNFYDLAEFVRAFSNQESKADTAMPFGKNDMMDIMAYVESFLGGCN